MQDLNLTGDISIPDARLAYYRSFLDQEEADALFATVLEGAPWRQDAITVFGKAYPQPRLTALFANNGKSYTYSGLRMDPGPFPPYLDALKAAVEAQCSHPFTTCLLNLYRDGQDSNGWHADNEKELGPDPVIASVSLGAPRAFHLKHRKEGSLRYRMILEHGSLLHMAGPMQHHWMHQIPKTQKPVGKRINLTFRYIP